LIHPKKRFDLAARFRTSSLVDSTFNEGQEFCGKYVFGVPLGEAWGVFCFSCIVPEPSFAAPSLSVGNWLAGCRSHALKASDTVAISTKYFFIKFRNLSTQRPQRKDSQKDLDSYFFPRTMDENSYRSLEEIDGPRLQLELSRLARF
jgi:hypothetical protein